MLRKPEFLAVIAAASLIQARHALYYDYGFSALSAWGGGSGRKGHGRASGVGVLAEFSVPGRLPAAMLPLLQCLRIVLGATPLSVLGFIAQTTPVGLAG